MMIKIIGAGMAGLLAGAILRDECEEIMEAQSSLPHNHTALLRFRSSIVGDAVNIPFSEVQVMKAVEAFSNPVADAISYSLKTNGTARLRSIVGAEGNFETRYIAPDDFVERLSAKVSAPILLDHKFISQYNGPPIISTIPMPALMDLLEYDRTKMNSFSSISGCSLSAELGNVDLCATVYIPDPAAMAYRASITRNKLIVEYAFPGLSYCDHPKIKNEENRHKGWIETKMEKIKANIHQELNNALRLFGLNFNNFVKEEPKLKKQTYAKILPIDETERKKFILWASEQHNIYSFGRFATWRPGLLMDDLVNDLRVIQRLINGGSIYDAKKEMVS